MPATVLMTWELGGGLGHMTGLKPLAEELLRRGHRVVLAIRDLARASIVFGQLDVGYWQAPIKLAGGFGDGWPTTAYVNMLDMIGFGNIAELATLAAGWRAIYDAVRPDLIVFEHSPIALLASRGLSCRRVVYGSGFVCPPPGPTLPILRSWANAQPEVVRQNESLACDRVNQLLARWHAPPLETLSDLYAQADETVLVTFAELDHFGPRPDTTYWGLSPFGSGESFQWPAGDGQRIYAYLKPSRALPELCQLLANWRFPTLIVADGIDAAIQRRHASATLRFVRKPLDLRQVANECDLAITNANHGTLAALMLGGRPVLNLPITLEQYIFAKRNEEQGYGLCVNPHDGSSIEAALRRMLETKSFTAAAQRFSAKYAGYDSRQAIEAMCDRVERLLPDASAC